jgi:hypothetical protein
MRLFRRLSHASVFDIPGWSSPLRVRALPASPPDAWGLLHVSSSRGMATVAVDERGRLWVDGSARPQWQVPNLSAYNPGAVVYRTPGAGIGVWIHPRAAESLPTFAELGMTDIRARHGWLPIREIAAVMPDFVRKP